MKQKIIVIAGPTAVGKSGLAVDIAKRFNGEIISADSVQIYKGADIGSAKIKTSEMQGIPHHLIDIKQINETFSAGDFAKIASKVINDIILRGKLPIIVGGTGLYINALLFPLTASCPPNPELREKLYNIKGSRGNDVLYQMLQKIDPASAETIHPKQTDRIVRAIEIYQTSGIKKSDLVKTTDSKYDYLYFVLNLEREALYDRINQRVDLMINEGFENEVKSLIKNDNLNAKSPLLSAIGYREMFNYINGDTTLNDCIAQIKMHSRNYAKRQITWFKKTPKAIFVNANDEKKIMSQIKEFINE